MSLLLAVMFSRIYFFFFSVIIILFPVCVSVSVRLMLQCFIMSHFPLCWGANLWIMNGVPPGEREREPKTSCQVNRLPIRCVRVDKSKSCEQCQAVSRLIRYNDSEIVFCTFRLCHRCWAYRQNFVSPISLFSSFFLVSAVVGNSTFSHHRAAIVYLLHVVVTLIEIWYYFQFLSFFFSSSFEFGLREPLNGSVFCA